MANSLDLFKFILNSDLIEVSTSQNAANYSTSSFRNDEYGFGLRTTQQVNTDFSKFENHCFFNSAVAKTNSAFEKLINRYPFDGTKKELLEFIDNLSGFEKYIFDNLPYNFGFLHFSGSLENYIIVSDKTTSNQTKTRFDPQDSSYTIEFCINIPSGANGNQIIFQKMRDDLNNGFSVYLSSSLISSETASLGFCVYSGSLNNNLNIDIKKGIFNHIAFVVDKTPNDYDEVKSYLNGAFVTSSNKNLLNDLQTSGYDLIIGSGSNFFIDSNEFQINEYFSGSLDEFRLFHSVKTENEIKYNIDRNVFANSDLKLYYKFNETSDISPTPSDSINSIVLDSSGNSSHAYIKNYIPELRKNITEDETIKVTKEKKDHNKVLFPGNSELLYLNSNLIEEAKEYDDFNPNIITKLLPKHYFIDGKLFESFENIMGEIENSFDSDNLNQIPKEFKLKNVQLLLSFLYIYANYFDEIKIFLDSITSLSNYTYQNIDSPPSSFLLNLTEKNGQQIHNIINTTDSNHIDFFEKNIEDENGNEYTIREIQDEILKRVLVNSNHIIKSKGTIESIKTLFRCLGIDPDISLRFKEYGGKFKNISELRETRKINSGMLLPEYESFLTSSFLKQERKATLDGPPISGNSSNDNLLTSGSWTIEFLAKYGKSFVENNEFNSLLRIQTTGSLIPEDEGCVSNVVVDSDLNKVIWHFNFEPSSSIVNKLELKVDNIHDNEVWNIIFGRENTQNKKNKYFLTVAKGFDQDKIEIYKTSSFIEDSDLNIQNSSSVDVNSDGLYIMSSGFLGDKSITQSLFLNSAEELQTNTNFYISNLKFWTKSLSKTEVNEHILNPFSIGIEDQIKNVNFDLNHSASYETLKMAVINKYNKRETDNNGEILLRDITNNEINLYGSNFTAETKILKPFTFYYSILSPNIDDLISSKKVRKKEELDDYERNDNNIFEISLSLIDSLNDEIINTFSDHNKIEQFLNDPNSLQSNEYKNLNYNKEIFFSNLEKKINFKLFFDFTKYFDLSLANAVSFLLPMKTKFRGITRNIESHLLERYKIEYKIPIFYLHKDILKNDSNQIYFNSF